MIYAHLYMLVFIISGQPEKVVATCATAVECNQLGIDAKAVYLAQMGKMPWEFNYRVYQIR